MVKVLICQNEWPTFFDEIRFEVDLLEGFEEEMVDHPNLVERNPEDEENRDDDESVDDEQEQEEELYALELPEDVRVAEQHVDHEIPDDPF
ncbi:unnamed protein product [Caenorhabditis auriculariae]|uniref:Uncharacterized protein n=1 Tax=Caenorhabditis auriculariae TaxID=2777116 RepID=A0A8S1H3Z6_9PELO|nr:unnamed protein product [Caenorhabditis auriculariae]